MSEMYFCPHLARKWVIPNSGRDCHAWMKRIFASIRLIWATFWWASRIRAEIWQTHHCHVSTGPEMIAGALQREECLEAAFTYSDNKLDSPPSSSSPHIVTYTSSTANTAIHQNITKTQSSSPWPIINVSWDFHSNLWRTYFEVILLTGRQTNRRQPPHNLLPWWR